MATFGAFSFFGLFSFFSFFGFSSVVAAAAAAASPSPPSAPPSSVGLSSAGLASSAGFSSSFLSPSVAAASAAAGSGSSGLLSAGCSYKYTNNHHQLSRLDTSHMTTAVYNHQSCDYSSHMITSLNNAIKATTLYYEVYGFHLALHKYQQPQVNKILFRQSHLQSHPHCRA